MTHEDLAHEAEMDSAVATITGTVPMPPVVVPGDEFSTMFESGCIALTAPDELGRFLGTDSDGVEVEFSVDMIDEVTREADEADLGYMTCTDCGDHVRPCACDNYEAALESRGYRF